MQHFDDDLRSAWQASAIMPDVIQPVTPTPPWQQSLETSRVWSNGEDDAQLSSPSREECDMDDTYEEHNIQQELAPDLSDSTETNHEDAHPDLSNSDNTETNINRRRTFEGCNHEDSHIPKRIAVSGPSQQALDSLREVEEFSRHKARDKSVIINQQAAQLQDMKAEIAMLREECSKFAVERKEYAKKLAEADDSEIQLAEHLLQYEKTIAETSDENRHLIMLINQGNEQLTRQQEEIALQKQATEAMQKRNEEIMDSINSMRAEYQKEKETQSNEILALRDRIRVMSTAQQPSRTPITPSPSPLRRYGRNQTRYETLRGNSASIGVVPLRPPVLNAAANGGTEASSSTENGSAEVLPPVNESNLTDLSESAAQGWIRQCFNRLGVAQVIISSAGENLGSNNRGSIRRSGRTRNREALEAQKKKISREDDLAWKETVRTAWKNHFKRSIADFALYDPTPEFAVEAFETGLNPGPDESNRLDFSMGYLKSRWNRVIIERLYNQLLVDREEDGTWNIPNVNKDYLTALFYGQLQRSREAWSTVQQRPVFDENRMETRDDVANRVSMYTEARMVAVNSRSRREQKYQRRVKTVDRVIALKSESDAPDLAAWTFFRDLLSKLSTNGMSSEEEGVEKLGDVTVPVFLIKLCIWRNPAVVEYCKYIDKESQNVAIRGRQGSKLHPRIYTEDVGHTDAPRGLPDTLYEAGWLIREEETRGKDWIEQELRVSREVFEMLEFTATV